LRRLGDASSFFRAKQSFGFCRQKLKNAAVQSRINALDQETKRMQWQMAATRAQHNTSKARRAFSKEILYCGAALRIRGKMENTT
jgi:hypothetical protein